MINRMRHFWWPMIIALTLIVSPVAFAEPPAGIGKALEDAALNGAIEGAIERALAGAAAAAAAGAPAAFAKRPAGIGKALEDAALNGAIEGAIKAIDNEVEKFRQESGEGG